tara:strand:- start:8 stop:328 length:321 start_codon:yes stop_codon:yes gene_type:complete
METTQIDSLESYNVIDSIDFGETVVFTKFGTEWCKPCVNLEKVLLTVKDSVVYKVDVENDAFEDFLCENRISNIPCTIIRYKKKKTQFVGMRNLTEIDRMIELLKA